MYIESPSHVRGQNKNIRVYRIKNNKPTAIGDADWNSASWPGARGAAVRIIGEADGYKNDGYRFKRKDISLMGV